LPGHQPPHQPTSPPTSTYPKPTRLQIGRNASSVASVPMVQRLSVCRQLHSVSWLGTVPTLAPDTSSLQGRQGSSGQ